ncbi:hypothetical protein, partial [Rhodococcus sp. Rp3]|uniref:hypothetical protein n=1 Tax=Rhodococcus sp. Rp3 TaxID=2807635 RepID=UPI00233EE251
EVGTRRHKTPLNTNSVTQQGYNPISQTRDAHYSSETLHTNMIHNKHCFTTHFKNTPKTALHRAPTTPHTPYTDPTHTRRHH